MIKNKSHNQILLSHEIVPGIRTISRSKMKPRVFEPLYTRQRFLNRSDHLSPDPRKSTRRESVVFS